MASAVDANVGTLLFHLNELRHPTRFEARLQQISDEYLLLTESVGKQKAPQEAKRGKISLEDLLEHLRDELETNLVPLPDAPSCASHVALSNFVFPEYSYLFGTKDRFAFLQSATSPILAQSCCRSKSLRL